MYGNGDENSNGEKYLYNFLENKCKIIFDVGAGVYPYYIMNNTITYHLFEPYVPIFKQLEEKIKDRPNIIANCIALGDAKKSYPFYFENGMSFVNRSGTAHSDMLIETITLDDYIQTHEVKHIDFLKIDTEGWEFSVLKGAIGSLNKINHIQFEYGHTWIEGGFHLKEAIDFLSISGFNSFIIVPNGLKIIPNFSDHGVYCNYFATRKQEEIQEIIR